MPCFEFYMLYKFNKYVFQHIFCKKLFGKRCWGVSFIYNRSFKLLSKVVMWKLIIMTPINYIVVIVFSLLCGFWLTIVIFSFLLFSSASSPFPPDQVLICKTAETNSWLYPESMPLLSLFAFPGG